MSDADYWTNKNSRVFNNAQMMFPYPTPSCLVLDNSLAAVRRSTEFGRRVSTLRKMASIRSFVASIANTLSTIAEPASNITCVIGPVEHRQNLRHRGILLGTVDRFAIALPELTQEVTCCNRCWQFTGPTQNVALIGVFVQSPFVGAHEIRVLEIFRQTFH